MDFPTWQYHAEHGAKLFETEEELKAAGAGWFDHPQEKKAESEPKVKRAYNRKG